jgi:hypothetical protein
VVHGPGPFRDFLIEPFWRATTMALQSPPPTATTEDVQRGLRC